MTDAIRELKIRAEILHGRVNAHDPASLERLRTLPEFRRSPAEQLFEIATTIRRHHCLTVIAAELGFANWPEASRVLSGESITDDFGTLLFPKRCAAHLNRWYTSYEDASSDRQNCRGYLLGYRRQYVVVDRYFIETLGLDPDDADWQAIGYDWARPLDMAARARLYARLIGQLPRETEVK